LNCRVWPVTEALIRQEDQKYEDSVFLPW